MLPFSKVLRLAFLLLLSMAMCACTPRHAHRHQLPDKTTQTLPRADPGYVQWLERQSMLGSSQDLSGQVSGTDLLWRNSASAKRVPLLLTAAPHWLDVNPYTVDAGQRVLRGLAAPDFLAFLEQAGFNGLFLSPTGETGDIWSGNTDHGAGMVQGEDVVSLHIAPRLGDNSDAAALIDALDKARIQLGGDLPPAATGLGPDFMLQARNAPRFEGLYAMFSVPQKDWDLLPAATGEWACLPLDGSVVQALHERDVLPGPLWRDVLTWPTEGGWAVTGAVRGVDGQVRRWAYRYSGTVFRPVLLWQDPSAHARRVWSAAIIHHTGLQRQTLAGLRLEALMGLDARSDTAVPPSADAAIVPGPEALGTLAGEVHRYGGWALQNDILPPSLTRCVLDTAVDFTRDSAVPAAVAYGLLCNDTGPLSAVLRTLLAQGVDCSRLAHGVGAGTRVDWRPLLDLPEGRDLVRRAQHVAKGQPHALGLAATTATLCANALGLDAAAACAPEVQKTVRDACLLLLGWRVGLPGLVFLSPQDLEGLLVLPDGKDTATVPLWEQVRAVRRTAPVLVFGPLADQWAREDSFARQVARLLQARRSVGLAQGRLAHVVSAPEGCIAVLSALPRGGYWLFAANFSGRRQRMTCPLPRDASHHARDVTDGHTLPVDGRNLIVELGARQSCHVLLDGRNTHGEMP